MKHKNRFRKDIKILYLNKKKKKEKKVFLQHRTLEAYFHLIYRETEKRGTVYFILWAEIQVANFKLGEISALVVSMDNHTETSLYCLLTLERQG